MRSIGPLVLVLVAAALASAACGDAAPAAATSDASSRDAAAPAPDAAGGDATAVDAGASDVGTSSAADAVPSALDAALGPSCAHLASCCASLPAAVFGPACDTAALGDEAACQAIVERAWGIDRCLRSTDGGR